MRVWLGAAFAGVSLITASSVYLFVNDSSGRALRTQATDLAVGRTSSLADELSGASRGEAESLLREANTDTFEVLAVTPKQQPIGSFRSDLTQTRRGRAAITKALAGLRYRTENPGDVTLAAAPIFDTAGVGGAVVSRATPPPALRDAIDELRGDSLRALAISIGAGILIGFVVASLIAIRVKRLAHAAEVMASGSFDVPLPEGGSDEIGDLTRSLDVMREALKGSFDLLATERDRLSAILDGLSEAVMVVGEEGSVRFFNPAAAPLVRDGQPASSLISALRQAAEEGSSERRLLTIEDRVYGVQARRVAAEHAVLLVVRERTDELKREQAEREFVSNAAHELRNPLAGISGAIEVLSEGAKDDPEARDHFITRLGSDVERMKRLTESLLILARVEAVGERGPVEVVDVTVAATEAVGAVPPPEGVELLLEAEADLVVEGDPVLLRQVMVGLLTNACKNTPAPGVVTLRAFQGGSRKVIIEVEDTGSGIAPDERERVFDRFFRGSGALEGEGFGLGLSIARRMVDVMGGEIGVRSVVGRGTTFWVSLRQPKPSPTPVA
jgi:two-component system phosphate regulon sensor histidine kinase PhoR